MLQVFAFAAASYLLRRYVCTEYDVATDAAIAELWPWIRVYGSEKCGREMRATRGAWCVAAAARRRLM